MNELPVRSAILDGEAVVLNEHGQSSFSALQVALGSRHGPGHRAAYEAVLYAFDVLYLDGSDMRSEPLEARRAALASLLSTAAETSAVRLSEHVEGQGEAMFRHACRMGLEGIVSKRRDRRYIGGPSRDWLKIKCLLREAFVIAGFIPSPGALGGLGALVLARVEGDGLVYAGRVGTGFTAASAREVLDQLQPLRIDRPPIAVPRDVVKLGVEWVRPERLGEVEHRGQTADGVLRHPAFRGLLGA